MHVHAQVSSRASKYRNPPLHSARTRGLGRQSTGLDIPAFGAHLVSMYLHIKVPTYSTRGGCSQRFSSAPSLADSQTPRGQERQESKLRDVCVRVLEGIMYTARAAGLHQTASEAHPSGSSPPISCPGRQTTGPGEEDQGEMGGGGSGRDVPPAQHAAMYNLWIIPTSMAEA